MQKKLFKTFLIAAMLSPTVCVAANATNWPSMSSAQKQQMLTCCQNAHNTFQQAQEAYKQAQEAYKNTRDKEAYEQAKGAYEKAQKAYKIAGKDDDDAPKSCSSTVGIPYVKGICQYVCVGTC